MTKLRGKLPSGVLVGAVIVTGYALVGLLGAVVWRAVVDLPRYARTEQGVGMDAIQLARVIGIDGSFAAVASPIALVLALLVTWRLPRRPGLAVVSNALGGIVAALVMVEVGRLIGPTDPTSVLRHAAVGTTAPARLVLHADGVAFLWPAFAVLGSLLILLTVVPTEIRSPGAAGAVAGNGEPDEPGRGRADAAS